jgi:hypothetical protein
MSFTAPTYTPEEFPMQQQQPAPAASTQTTATKQPIPQYLVDRLESEWKQMRETVPASVPAR